jgi:DNA repair protein RecN (Recombination protein N)
MLTELVVEGVGVIERAELGFERGSSALTGETGAGKTLVVAAVGLLLGGRADRGLIRTGAKQARVEGRFLLSAENAAIRRLAAEGVIEGEERDEAELVVTRAIAADGSGGRARINGRLVTRALVAEIAPALVEIAGQHEHQRISAPGWQRATLDRFAGAEAMRQARAVAEAVRGWRAAEDELATLRAAERDRHRELDALRWQIAEIEKAHVVPGEHDRMVEEIGRLEQAEALAEGLAEADRNLRAEQGAVELIAGTESTLQALVSADPELGSLAERLESARLEVEDVAQELKAREVSADPVALEGAHERLAQLAALRRKYGDDETQVVAYLARARERSRDLERAADDVAGLERRRDDLAAAAERAASALSTLRAEAAPRLSAAVEARLAELALGGARFLVHLESTDMGEQGRETVEFRLAADPGEPLRSLKRIASGGELSRISLALHLAARDELAATMVFDEVDAGVGGAAAQAVGRSLAELARSSGAQVVVVTHLPQVAAFADAQYRVLKSEDRGRSTATVARVEGAARIQELSRMMAGLPESERAREHARELLELAAAGTGT